MAKKIRLHFQFQLIHIAIHFLSFSFSSLIAPPIEKTNSTTMQMEEEEECSICLDDLRKYGLNTFFWCSMENSFGINFMKKKQILPSEISDGKKNSPSFSISVDPHSHSFSLILILIFDRTAD